MKHRDQPLRNAQVISNLKVGGAQKLLCILAENQDPARLDTRVVVLDRPEPTQYHHDLQASGVPVTYIGSNGASMAARIRALAHWFRKERIAVAHSHLQRANIVTGPAGILTGVPTLAGLHTPHIATAQERSWRYRIETLVLRSCPTTVVACSGTAARSHRERLAGRRIEVATNPVAIPPFVPAKATSSTATTKFLVVGRLAPEKAVDVILKAVARLKAMTIDFHVTIAGDGAEGENLKALCRSLGVCAHVTFLGTVSDMTPIYRSQDIYLSASRSEGLSLALLEAMAHGLPSIVSAAGDAPRLVTDKTGLCLAQVDPERLANAMSDMAAQRQTWPALGKAARSTVLENHSPKAWCIQLASHYFAAVNRRPHYARE